MPLIDMPTGTRDVDPRHRFETDKLEELLKREIDEFEGPLTVLQFRGGQSNPTYELSDPNGRWVLRRKPPGPLLESAHAVDREFRVISALNETDFPVPRARLLCDDESVIGTMFFVMDHVDGRVLWDGLLPDFEPDQRARLYDSINATLAQLHQVDPAAVGLGDYGRPGNYFARQVSRWTRQYRASETDPVPDMERMIEWLPGAIPDETSTAIVHGDYSLNNMLVHPSEPRVVAVLDWELSTLGHPFADVTYMMSQRHSPTSPFHDMTDAELSALGVPTEAEYIDAYCRRTGRDGIPNLDFYLAFHFFRSAAILQGIAGRVKSGTAAGERAMEVSRTIGPLSALAVEYASKLGA